jgi:hypothetical protein
VSGLVTDAAGIFVVCESRLVEVVDALVETAPTVSVTHTVVVPVPVARLPSALPSVP